MHPIAKSPAREYRSALREEQARATRTRILDATLRVMARGLAEVSIPAVAREANVSVPTVYRHFPNKADLLAALYPHLAERVGLQRFEDLAQPQSLDDLRDGIRAIFSRIETVGFDALAVAAFSSPASDEVRRATMPRRLAAIKPLLEVVAREVPDAERDRIARLLVIVTSSAALRTWLYLGSSADEAADDVSWMMQCLVGAATSRSQTLVGRRSQ